MSHSDGKLTSRRDVIATAGSGIALLPLAGVLTACGGGESEQAARPAAEPAPPKPAPSAAAETAAPEPAPEAAPEPDPEPVEEPATPPAKSAADMPRLTEDDPAAEALGYRHDATQIDQAKYARYEAGQRCANCTLYEGAEGAAWGPCSIFPGKRVNANGWCSTYAPRA